MPRKCVQVLTKLRHQKVRGLAKGAAQQVHCCDSYLNTLQSLIYRELELSAGYPESSSSELGAEE